MISNSLLMRPATTSAWMPAARFSEAAPAAPLGDPTDQVSLSGLGPRLAQSTLEAASDNDNLARFRCFRFVKEGLSSEGIDLTGGHAYMAADQLANSPRFDEVQVSRDQLPDLPAGAVVVWNRNTRANHPSGHISVSLGDGREVSDRVRPQTTAYRSTFRVFLPEGTSLETTVADSQPRALPAEGLVG